MKKLIALILLVLFVRLLPHLNVRLNALLQETEVAAETVAEIPAETTAETEPAPPETTQPGSVLEMRRIYFESGYETDATALTVFDCRMYTLDNGYTRFEVDYQTAADLYPIAFAYIGEEHRPAFWYESRTPTTSGPETLVFEMETRILNQSNGPDVHFQNRSYESVSYILIYPDQSID